MDRVRFSTLAHGDHMFASPVSAEKMDRLLSLLPLTADQRVLDVGCGNAEVLMRLIERTGVVGVGVDPNAAMIALARRRARERISSGRLHVHDLAIADFVVEEQSFAAALCIGASHAYGGYMHTLRAFQRLVVPGGYILIGEGYWKREPVPAYLALLGATPDELTSHADTVARASTLGLTLLYSAVSSEDEWDVYEGLYCRAIEQYVAAHPDDPEAEDFRSFIRQWYNGYLQWGRDTLGFGFYLFRV